MICEIGYGQNSQRSVNSARVSIPGSIGGADALSEVLVIVKSTLLDLSNDRVFDLRVLVIIKSILLDLSKGSVSGLHRSLHDWNIRV